jgi:hypothetical protein
VGLVKIPGSRGEDRVVEPGALAGPLSQDRQQPSDRGGRHATTDIPV